MTATTAARQTPMIAYPSTHGGKYHAASAVTDLAYCDGRTSLTVALDNSIHVTPGQTRTHAIVCRRCLRAHGFAA